MSKFADVNDQASEQEEADKSNALDRVRMASKPMQLKDANGEWEFEDCQDCGREIGLPRLEATGSLFCVHCMQLRESKGKFYAR